MSGIYVHIPFCAEKCTYCDFASYPREMGKAEAYFACLYKEMRYRAKELGNKSFDTVYFGGGTPSFVDPKYILGAMRLIRDEFKLAHNAEITIEINPKTLTADNLKVYDSCGINRYSVGMQCADDKILASLNRVHDIKDFVQTMKLLPGRNISVDIMIGLIGQDERIVKESIELAHTFGSKHISLYALKAEEGTVMYSHYLNGDLPDEETIADLYDFSLKLLEKLGYKRYEVSNFAMEGCESKHNLNYWRRGEYIGCGVGASSFIGERRFTNSESIDEYVKLLLSDMYAEVFSEKIEGDECKFEYIMLALRTAKGIAFDDYKKMFKEDFMVRFNSKVKSLLKYLNVTEHGLSIRDEYLYVQNNIIIQFME